MTPEEAIKTVHCCMHIGNDIILQARDMAIIALEKQIPKKPINWYSEYICPACSTDLYIENEEDYCTFCGQALDWSEEVQNDKPRTN